MKKTTWFWPLYVLVLAVLCSADTVNLVPTVIANTIKMSVPQTFNLISGNAQGVSTGVSIKKPTANNLATYQDKRTQADFTVSQTPTPWSDKDVEMLRDFYRVNIKSLYTNVVFSKDALEKVNKRQFAVFEFVSEVAEKDKPTIKKYTYVQYTVRKQKVYVFNFTCSDRDRVFWQQSVTEMMHTVKF